MNILRSTSRNVLLLTAIIISLLPGAALAQNEVYHYYFGNTHAHTSCSDGGNSTPAQHYSLAKAQGYDFYAITNHALRKYPNFTPETYEKTKREADKFTDDKFVALIGFEFSENDGPTGKGHINVLNSADYLDATGKKVNLPVFYDWLVKHQTTPVAASFNHPGKNSYNDYDYLTPARRDCITMYEMINSGKLHYPGFIAALNKGWRIAPMAGQDGHGIGRITKHDYRTGVLAASLTRDNIIQAMRDRRVYCTWDKNLRLSFSANGKIMGSVLEKTEKLDFQISVSDPDTSDPNDKITRVEIVGNNGKLIEGKDSSAYTVTWGTSCSLKQKYYFVKVYTAGKTDGPTAYSAPVWIEDAAAQQ